MLPEDSLVFVAVSGHLATSPEKKKKKKKTKKTTLEQCRGFIASHFRVVLLVSFFFSYVTWLDSGFSRVI